MIHAYIEKFDVMGWKEKALAYPRDMALAVHITMQQCKEVFFGFCKSRLFPANDIFSHGP
jgi:hypothetical protein